MRVLITRAREDAEPLAAELARLGVESLIEPLLSIVYEDGPDLDLENVQAVLATSANGLRALARRTEARDIRVLAVGDATARAAAEAGFRTVLSATGDVDALAALAASELDPETGPLLHAAGSRLAGDLGGQLERAGFTYLRRVLYRAETVAALSVESCRALEAGAVDGVLLYSPRTAAVFVELVRDAGLEGAIGGVVAYCLSAAVADRAAGLDWRALRKAVRPDQSALLDAIAAEA